MTDTIRLAAAALLRTVIAGAALVAAAPAQNCAVTSTGRVPLSDLGTGLYQGFQGGLWPGGTNVAPEAHQVGGLRAAQAVVPRDAAGAPDPAGLVGMISIGMSNATQEFQRFVQLSNADATRHARVRTVDCAQGGQTADDIDDPLAPFWGVVDSRLATAGVSAAQVQVVWLKEANRQPSDPFPGHALTLETQYGAIARILQDRFPNLRLCFLASRIYAGYATTALNPEPYAYEQAFALKWLIEDQIGGAPLLNYDPARGVVEAPWLGWGTYNWADGLVPRSDGLTWLCTDFQPDGTHPAAGGREKVAQALLAFVRTDPVAAAWYLATPPPAKFGLGKTTSIGTLPSLAWSGTPSPAGAFALALSGCRPGSPGVVFHGPGADRVPFVNAQRYVAVPLTRLPVHFLDGTGASSWPFAVSDALVGTTRAFQGYARDATHPDGTGAVVSDGLRVVFHP